MKATKMKKILICYGCLFAAAIAQGANSKKVATPVAEGFPAWTGVTPKNYISGRELVSGADLRERLMIVVEFDAAKTKEQLDLTGPLQSYVGYMPDHIGSGNWESRQIPHGLMVVYVARNCTSAQQVTDNMLAKYGEGLAMFVTYKASVYRDVTFDGAPDSGGKYPFVYLMDAEGKEPLYKGTYDGKDSLQKLLKVYRAARARLKENGKTWRPYYGFVDEPKHFGADMEKSLKKGRPTFEALELKLLKAVSSPNAEVAKEAQLLYDGLEQTKSDLIYAVTYVAAQAPHVAAYKLDQLTRQWPSTKKKMSDYANTIKGAGAYEPLVKIYPKLMEWSNPEFVCKNAGEAKKIVAELQKMKKKLEPLKEQSKQIGLQNSALVMDAMVDELIETVPVKVSGK